MYKIDLYNSEGRLKNPKRSGEVYVRTDTEKLFKLSEYSYPSDFHITNWWNRIDDYETEVCLEELESGFKYTMSYYCFDLLYKRVWIDEINSF